MKNRYFWAILIAIIFIAEFISCKNYMKHHPIIKNKLVYTPVVEYKNKKGVIVDITYQTLANDLKVNYSFLSKNQQEQILNAVKQASVKYSINPLVIYSLISVESSFRFWVVSPRRLVVGSDKRKHYDNAIGLMSIVYSIWGNKLKKAHILTTKTELYQIEPNIKAGSYILKILIDRNKGNIIKALESYFGKSNYARIYQHKIRVKIGSLLEKQIF